MPALFERGHVVLSQGVHDWIAEAAEPALRIWAVSAALTCHSYGDWGDLDAEDKLTNLLSVSYGVGMILSAREVDGREIIIITEGDRSATTILFPEER